jgi:hypothetical protein
MRRWIIIALAVIGIALVATLRVGPVFTPLKPDPGIPTFSQVSGQSSKLTDYQPAYLQEHIECAYPGYPDGAQVVLLSAGRGQAISSASLGGQDVSTTVVSVVVEPGDAPLYVISTASSAVLWRVSGATGRIRRLVLASTHAVTSSEWGTRIPMGETGVPRDNVTFLPDTKCLLAFEKPSSPDASYDADRVKERVGHAPAVIAGRYAVTRFSIPSGTLEATGLGDSERGRELQKDRLLSFLSSDPLAGHPLDYDVALTYPDGVIKIASDDVIANVPVERYDTLPGSAGLQQLVASGALTEIGNDQYHIMRGLRMPAELRGVHFTLMKGVPRPDGKYDGVCVAAEETGQPISSQNRTAWPAC